MDGSHYQPDAGPMDLAVTKAASGADWIAWKATQSVSYVDATFKPVRDQVRNLGFTYRFFYHWLSSTTDPFSQAQHYLKTLGTLQVGEGCMLDAEEGGISVEKCLIFLEAVEAVTKRPMSVYSGIYVAGGTIWRDPRIRTSAYGDRPMHLAAYISVADLEKRLTQLGIRDLPIHAWQYSSNGPVPGITGRCDMNAILDIGAMSRAAGYQSAPTPPAPAPSPEPGDTVDDVRTITNEKTYSFQGQDYGPNVIKWLVVVQGDGSGLAKLHLQDYEYEAIGAGLDTEKAMASEKLDKMPDYKPQPAGGGSVVCPPIVGTIQLSGTLSQ